jgi:hypothetical protein
VKTRKEIVLWVKCSLILVVAVFGWLFAPSVWAPASTGTGGEGLFTLVFLACGAAFTALQAIPAVALVAILGVTFFGRKSRTQRNRPRVRLGFWVRNPA